MWKAGLYPRLSKDDDNYGSVSMSITNQIDLMKNWIEEQTNIQLIDIYPDDGYSGATFDRPGYKEMMFDIETGRIDCIIVKDLSRLGRNTSKISYLKDEFFPSKGVRFIAINDNVDTNGGIDESDVTDFKLVFNEYYLKDISKKTKTALRTRAKNGDFIGSFAPYGYRKSDDNYHKLEIDTEAALIVRRIFSEYADGKSGREIADNLNYDGILSPINYRLNKQHKELLLKHWTSTVIYGILNNEVYFGNMVQHKRESISYKIKKRKKTSPEDWIIVNNTHEAIIDDTIRDIIKKRKENNIQTRNRKRKDGSKLPIIFSSLLTCCDCNNKLAATTKNGKRCYRCSRYNMSGKNACTSHLIYEENLLKYVKKEIDKLAYEYQSSNETFTTSILRQASITKQNEIAEAKNKLNKIKNEICELEENILQAYEDKRNGVLSHKMFSIISKNYNDKLETLLNSKKEYDNIIDRNNTNKAYVINWINSLIEISKSKTYTTKQLNKIIDTIYIGNPKDKHRIQIKYKIGFLNDCENQIKITA